MDDDGVQRDDDDGFHDGLFVINTTVGSDAAIAVRTLELTLLFTLEYSRSGAVVESNGGSIVHWFSSAHIFVRLAALVV